MGFLKLSFILINISFAVIASLAFQFEDRTNETFAFGDGNAGIMAAFGHFNFDEYTDLITLQQGRTKLQLRIGSEKQPYFQDPASGLLNCSFGKVITSVVPADFDGDSILDMLVTLGEDEQVNEVKILWGQNYSIDCRAETIFKLSKQPIIVDYNGDMIPDVIGEDEHDQRYVWIASNNKNFHAVNLTKYVNQTIRKSHSSGLIDLNHDMAPDILIMGESYIEAWLHTGNGFVQNDSFKIYYPPKAQWISQSVFVDINLDERLDIVMPVCYDTRCASSEILVWNANLSKWDPLLHNFKHPEDNSQWGFKLAKGTNHLGIPLYAILRAGDLDLDGYPDFIVVLENKYKPNNFQGVILRNVPCGNCSTGRELQVDWNVPGLKDLSNIEMAAFFDIYEDGTLDILAATNVNGDWRIHALINTDVMNSCFLKVLVLNGLSQNKYRPYGTLPYGINQPGPMVKYNITRHDGQHLASTSIQLSQSSFFSLQLPYTLFGLGPTPNFVDVLTVSIPAVFNTTVHKREWLQIIPNSQIVVIPHPPLEEKQWEKKLFVTPSHLVLLTLISLIGTCIFLSLLVALLHWNERREDKKEKMQDAYRFHFDAM